MFPIDTSLSAPCSRPAEWRGSSASGLKRLKAQFVSLPIRQCRALHEQLMRNTCVVLVRRCGVGNLLRLVSMCVCVCVCASSGSATRPQVTCSELLELTHAKCLSRSSVSCVKSS